MSSDNNTIRFRVGKLFGIGPVDNKHLEIGNYELRATLNIIKMGISGEMKYSFTMAHNEGY